jgi:hypothetical protein
VQETLRVLTTGGLGRRPRAEGLSLGGSLRLPTDG